MIRHCLVIVAVSLMAAPTVSAQKEKEEVKAVIDNLFKAMLTGDSALAKTTFASQVTSATVFKDKSGVVKIRREDSVAAFIKAIGSPHDQPWHEEIWNVTVQVDGDFAQAWCDYAFYVGNQFSHCGVDAMHLMRENGQWKIFHLADTRRKAPCDIPQAIADKHK